MTNPVLPRLLFPLPFTWSMEQQTVRNEYSLVHAAFTNPSVPSARIELRQYLASPYWSAAIELQVMRAQIVVDQVFHAEIDIDGIWATQTFTAGDFVVAQIAFIMTNAEGQSVALQVQLTARPEDFDQISEDFLLAVDNIDLAEEFYA